MQNYAVVDIQGKQFIVEEGLKLCVPYLSSYDKGVTISLDKVLLVSQGDKLIVGQPRIDSATVDATVLGHERSEKVIVFKKKRRKGYKKKAGHRQTFTKLVINSINNT